MKHNYTFNYLLKYLYGETGILRKLEIENTIQEDPNVKREYFKLRKAYKSLPKISFYPSRKTINAILDYSQKSSLNPSF